MPYFIGAKNRSRTEFFTASSLAATPYADSTDARSVEYAPVTTQECVKTDQPVVIDIDLDYFCCNEHPRLPVLEVKTTKAEYEKFLHDPYHFLRIAGGERYPASLGEKDISLSTMTFHIAIIQNQFVTQVFGAKLRKESSISQTIFAPNQSSRHW